MQMIMLLWPHANARYRNETARLAEAEARYAEGRLEELERKYCLGEADSQK